MAKRFFVIIALINFLLIFGFLGYSQVTSASDISEVITQHYRYLESGNYQGAYGVLTKASRKYLSVEQFGEYREQVGLESSRLFRFYRPAVKDNFGVVCFVIINKIRGNEYPLFNVGFMRKEEGKWAMVGDIREIPVSLGLDVFTLMVRAEEEVKKDKTAFSGLSKEDQESLNNQLKASYDESSAYLEAFKIYESRKDQPQKENTQDKVYKEETAVDVGLHGGF